MCSTPGKSPAVKPQHVLSVWGMQYWPTNGQPHKKKRSVRNHPLKSRRREPPQSSEVTHLLTVLGTALPGVDNAGSYPDQLPGITQCAVASACALPPGLAADACNRQRHEFSPEIETVNPGALEVAGHVIGRQGRFPVEGYLEGRLHSHLARGRVEDDWHLLDNRSHPINRCVTIKSQVLSHGAPVSDRREPVRKPLARHLVAVDYESQSMLKFRGGDGSEETFVHEGSNHESGKRTHTRLSTARESCGAHSL